MALSGEQLLLISVSLQLLFLGLCFVLCFSIAGHRSFKSIAQTVSVALVCLAFATCCLSWRSLFIQLQGLVPNPAGWSFVAVGATTHVVIAISQIYFASVLYGRLDSWHTTLQQKISPAVVIVLTLLQLATGISASAKSYKGAVPSRSAPLGYLQGISLLAAALSDLAILVTRLSMNASHELQRLKSSRTYGVVLLAETNFIPFALSITIFSLFMAFQNDTTYITPFALQAVVYTLNVLAASQPKCMLEQQPKDQLTSLDTYGREEFGSIEKRTLRNFVSPVPPSATPMTLGGRSTPGGLATDYFVHYEHSKKDYDAASVYSQVTMAPKSIALGHQKPQRPPRAQGDTIKSAYRNFI